MSSLDTRNSPLIVEFLKDHQQFSRLLYRIRNLLDSGDLAQAQKQAIELDRLAGPHIMFEEQELYPKLAELGEQNVTEALLLGQHDDARDALRQVLEMSTEDVDQEELESTKLGFDKALEHAEHCGSLISLMTQLDDLQQKKSLDELVRLRNAGVRWTELER